MSRSHCKIGGEIRATWTRFLRRVHSQLDLAPFYETPSIRIDGDFHNLKLFIP